MFRLALALSLPLFMAACGEGGLFDPGTGAVVGQRDGAPIYATSCQPDQSLIGSRGLFNTKATPFTAYHSCEPQAEKTCPTGYRVVDIQRGQPERRTDTFQNGNMIQRRTYFIRPTTINYICAS